MCKSLLLDHADVSFDTKGLSLHLHPYFVFTSSEGSDNNIDFNGMIRFSNQSCCLIGAV